MEKEVQTVENGQGAESAVQEEPKRQWESMDALKEAIQTDKAVRDDFLANEKEYKIGPEANAEEEKKPVVAEIPGEKPEAEEKKESSEPQPDETVETAVKVTDEMLGGYLKDGNRAEAVLAALKDNQEKNKTIQFLQKDKLPHLEKELQELRQNTLNLQKQLKTYQDGAVKAVPKPEVEAVDVSDESIFFTEDGQGKIKKSLNSVKALKDYTASLEKQLEDAKAGRLSDSSAADDVSGEFQEYDRIAAANEEFIGAKRPSAEIQKDYLRFMENLKIISGATGDVLDQEGQFTPAIQEQYRLYHEDSPAGKALRDKCLSRNVAMPPDFDALGKLYAIRNIRYSTFERNAKGESVPISWDRATNLYKLENPPKAVESKPEEKPEEKSAEPPKKAMSEAERREKAAEKMQAGGKDMPADAGGDLVDLSKYPTETFMKQMQRPKSTWNDTEVRIFKQLYRSKGFSEDWLKNELGDRY